MRVNDWLKKCEVWIIQHIARKIRKRRFISFLKANNTEKEIITLARRML
jgi:beta-lactamase class D